ncbi:serine threonine kinase [Micractinium conductrix]|uniref:non-specific serine/threonine protein kinase n=1 Tax=Micractinium conductrix TaxID=554055 RepID=A0A2P6VRP1_9CHLO|nr:serine threonine kinase [Micractinium conductrix]|eukprot:PSC76759.1 serine threonine kinase [Micractinium conductrix]
MISTNLAQAGRPLAAGRRVASKAPQRAFLLPTTLLRRSDSLQPRREPSQQAHHAATATRRRRRQRPASAVAQPSDRGPLPGQLDFPPGTLLGGDKYEVVDVLGRGGNGVTYRCRSTTGGGDVAIKCLSLRSLKDWKQLELFEREAQTLKGLEHKNIPRYLDYFEQDTEQDRAFFLVQEAAQGKSLAEMVRSGWRADEAEVTRIATELLQVLQYLGSRRPPVAHRDVKPENIVIEGGRTGGRVFLVDFGGVQAAATTAEDTLGSTIVGTYGYMAPEQFRGAASPASDLYGLGGTLLFLLSGRLPSAFPMDRMRIDFGTVKMGARLEAVLEGLLEPVPEDRLSAEDALALLTGQPRPARDGRQGSGGGYGSPGSPYDMRRPAGSKIQVKKRGPRLEIDIPPSGFGADNLATGAFALAWNSFVAFWTISAVAGGGVLFGLFSLPFWAAGWQLAKQAFGRGFVRERVVINLNSWSIEQQLAFARKGGADWDEDAGQRKQTTGRTADLQGADMEVPMVVNGEPQYQLVLQEGINRYVLGEGLNPLEQEWLAQIINEHIEENRGRLRELGEFAGGAAERALPAGSTASGSGQRYPDWAAKEGAAAARQAELAAAKAGSAARRAGERAAADARRRGAEPALRIAAADGSLRIEVTGEACLLEARFPATAAEGSSGSARGVHLRAECEGPPVLWDDSGFGPEGPASAVPGRLTGLHWFVHSLGTPMRFTLRQGSPADAATVHGHALAHCEKNWGRAFPSGWHWAQGINASSSAASSPDMHASGSDSDASGSDSSSSNSDGDGDETSRRPATLQAAFALGGGALPSPLLPEFLTGWLPDVWLLGVRTPSRSWDFHAFDSIFTAQADPCAASLLLSATQPLARRGVDVQIRTRPTSFASLEGPTGEGFKHYMDESLAAYATVRLFELTPSWSEPGFFQRRLVEAWEFDGSALEFGGDRRCQKEPKGVLQKAAEEPSDSSRTADDCLLSDREVFTLLGQRGAEAWQRVSLLTACAAAGDTFYQCRSGCGCVVDVGALRGMVTCPACRLSGCVRCGQAAHPGNAIMGEMVMTFVLVGGQAGGRMVSVVLETAVNEKGANVRSEAPLAIGFAVFCAHAVMLPIDGCSINPARSLGPAIVSGTWPGHFWIFIVGPLAGALFACPFHIFFRSDWDTVSETPADPAVGMPKDPRQQDGHSLAPASPAVRLAPAAASPNRRKITVTTDSV